MMTLQIITFVLFLFSLITLYLYYIGYIGNNKVINSVLANKPIIFYFIDFLIITVVIIAMFIVF